MITRPKALPEQGDLRSSIPQSQAGAVKLATAMVQSLGKVRLFAGDTAGSVEPGGQVERPGCVQSGAQSRELDLLWG